MKSFNSGGKIYSGIASVLILSMIAAGCSEGSSNKEGNPSDSASAGDKPTEISIMTTFFGAEPIKQDDPIIQELEAYTNTKLDITWVPSSAYNDKVNVTLAADSPPEAMLIIDNKAQNVVNAVRSGAFWEVGPYLDEYPNLKALSKEVLNNISVDGKVYGLFRGRDYARVGLAFRKDWLANVGLEEPKTLDEVLEVIKAFTLNDPDRNGKDDTFGLLLDGDMGAFLNILNYMGGPNRWKVEDGKFIPDFMTDEHMETLKLFRQLYNDKMINQDFALVKGAAAKDLLQKGKGGMYSGVLGDAVGLQENTVKLFPDANWDIISRIEGPKGHQVMGQSGYFGVFMFPKSSVKDEQELKQVLQFFDKMSDQKITDMLSYGIEGKNYTLKDGVIEAIPDSGKTSTDYVQLRIDESKLTNGNSNPLFMKFKKMYKENIDLAVMNPAEPYISQVQTEKGLMLDEQILDGRVQFIMGKIDEAGWADVVEQWKASGGEQMMEEYADAAKQ